MFGQPDPVEHHHAKCGAPINPASVNLPTGTPAACRSTEFELHAGPNDQMRRTQIGRVCPVCRTQTQFAVLMQPTDNAWGTAGELGVQVPPEHASLVCCRYCRGFRFKLSEAGNEVATKCDGCGHKATMGFLTASQA